MRWRLKLSERRGARSEKRLLSLPSSQESPEPASRQPGEGQIGPPALALRRREAGRLPAGNRSKRARQGGNLPIRA